jgi:hypothetical protein
VKIGLWIFYLGEGVGLGNEWDDIDPVVNALQELDIQWPDHMISWSELQSQPRPLNVTVIRWAIKQILCECETDARFPTRIDQARLYIVLSWMRR